MQLLDTLVARAIPWAPHALIHKISRRYIAGDNLTDALLRVRQLAIHLSEDRKGV